MLYFRFSAVLLGVLCLFGAVSPAQAQIYHIYRPVPLVRQKPIARTAAGQARMNMGISPVVSLGEITDCEGDTISSAMTGVRLQISFFPSDSLEIGAEATFMRALDQHFKEMSSLENYVFAAVLKWTILSDTIPQLYVLASAGRVYYRGYFPYANDNFNKQGFLGSIGLGNKWELGPRWRVNIEYRLSYTPKVWDSFIFSAPVWRPELAAGLHFLF